MKNITSSALRSSELAQANDHKSSEKAKPPVDENAHNRVRLYAPHNSYAWHYIGTGHVDCVQSRNQSDAWWIVMRHESNKKNILESRILANTIYQKEEGTMIVWSESDICDVALSFYEKAGCDKIWNKICQIQGKDQGVEDVSVLATNEALKQELEESKAVVDTAHRGVKDLEESTCDLEKKFQNSEAKLSSLEQELIDSQAKIRNLEAKFAQTNVGQLIQFMEEKSESLKNCEVSGLQDLLETKNNELEKERKLRLSITQQLGNKAKEAAKLCSENTKVKRGLSDCKARLADADRQNVDLNKENAKIKRELRDTQKRLTSSEKRIVGMNKENAKVKRDLLDSQKRLKTVDKLIKEKEDMSVELKRWEHLRQLLGEATEYAGGLGKKNAENKQSLQPQSTPRLVPIMPPAAWDDVALATNEELKQELAESKAKVNAAQTHVKDLVESTCDW